MRFAVEAWAPEYGSPADEAALEASVAEVDAAVEVEPAAWAATRPEAATRALDELVVVDGVRRIDAHLWITGDDGALHEGFCASYAAGAVRCDGRARLVAHEVRRGVFTAAPQAAAIETSCGTFAPHLAGSDDAADLSLRLQARMGALENEVAEAVPPDGADRLTLVDGPLKVGQDDDRFVGYVKTHRRTYGPEVVREVTMALDVGERTPLFVVRDRPRFSWYLRLPCARTHGWEGVVRLETPTTRSVADTAALADRLTVTLPRLASTPVKDSRAPQNLFPIAGLERELRRRLGDAALVWRALRAAASRT